MPPLLDIPPGKSVLVSDFDGTMTRHDFYQLVIDRRLSPGTPNYWTQYEEGRITHFDALAKTFAAATGGEPALVELTRAQELDPDLAPELDALRGAGWEVVVISAGCRWYIDLLLEGAGVEMIVHANPGRIEEGRLLMERPAESPFPCHEVGIDKAAVVRAALEGGRTVAFAGDGRPDLEPALLVPPERRFARKTLAELLREQGEDFRPFERWAEVARALRGEEAAG